MIFGTRNVRFLHRSHSLTTAARELARYKLDFVGVHEVRWDKRGAESPWDFFLWKKKRQSSIGNSFILGTPKNSICG